MGPDLECVLYSPLLIVLLSSHNFSLIPIYAVVIFVDMHGPQHHCCGHIFWRGEGGGRREEGGKRETMVERERRWEKGERKELTCAGCFVFISCLNTYVSYKCAIRCYLTKV